MINNKCCDNSYIDCDACTPNITIPPYRGRETKRSLTRKRNGADKEKRKYERIYRISLISCLPSGVDKKERDGKEYYKRYYRGKRSKYLKRLSNKAVRRYKGDISGKGGYKKLFDYWWELY